MAIYEGGITLGVSMRKGVGDLKDSSHTEVGGCQSIQCSGTQTAEPALIVTGHFFQQRVRNTAI